MFSLRVDGNLETDGQTDVVAGGELHQVGESIRHAPLNVFSDSV